MTAPKERLGFIGLGAMGKPMAQNIAKRLDIPVNVYDVRADAVADAKEWGGVVCDSPAAVAEASDVVFTMLPEDAHFVAVALGPAGIVEHARDGLVVVDFSTLGPWTIRDVDAALREKRARCHGAAVTLGVPAAVAGTLSVYVDAEVNENDDLMAFIGGCAATVLPISGPGSAKVIKLVNNLLTGVNFAAISEVFALGVKAGVPAETLLRLLLKGSGASYIMEHMLGDAILQGDMGPARFSVNYMIKDVTLAQELGRRNGHPSHFAGMALSAYNGTKALGLENDFVGSVIRWYEKAANMPPVGPTEKAKS